MSDLIDRQNAINAMMALKQEDDERYGCEIPEGFDGKRAVEALEKLPSAEPERTAKAKWYPYLTILADGNCECGEDVRHEWKYCPRCGGRLEWE